MSSDRSIFQLLRDFFPHVSSRRRKQLVLLVLLMLMGSVAELVTIGAVIPFISLMANPESAFQFPLLQRFFAILGWQKPSDILAPMVVLFLIIVSTAMGVRLLLLWASNRFVYALGYDVGVALYHRTLSQPYSFHIESNTSETIAAINKVQAILNGAVKPVLEGVIAFTLGLAILSALMWIQPLAMTIAAATFVLAYLVIVGLTRLRLMANSKRVAAAHTQRVRSVQEGLGGIRDIILDNNQNQATRVFARADHQLRQAQASNAFLNQAPRYFIEALGIFLIVGMAWLLAAQSDGLVSALPVLGALALGAQRLLPLLQKAYQAWAKITGNQRMFADILDILELPTHDAPNKAASSLEFRQAIRLQNVAFSYGSDQKEVLDGIDLVIGKGRRVGIIGPTGSGKSTLVDIIMGLLKPSEGHVLVDDTPLNDANRESWQRNISHVPQHIFLIDASFAENIALGVPPQRIKMDRVRKAARLACLAEFIESNPKGYQATVGERGIQLSGGQRQRLGIARALYRKADILIFDEATSALDSKTEAAVMRYLEEHASDVTIIMIAHRMSTLSWCNVIIRLNGGRIVDSGGYEQMMAAYAPAEPSTRLPVSTD